jgi:hypothetical protein
MDEKNFREIALNPTVTNELFKIGNYRHFSSTYLETGSCYGQSIHRALDGKFDRIKSVELHKPYYEYCVTKFKNNPVELFLGKSTNKLEQMLADVYEPIVIFLDAHPAGEGTESHEEWVKGNTEFYQHFILTKEIEIILEHRKDHLVIIDDQVFGQESDSYMVKLKEANPNYSFLWYDEQLAPHEPVTKNKILVCIP